VNKTFCRKLCGKDYAEILKKVWKNVGKNFMKTFWNKRLPKKSETKFWAQSFWRTNILHDKKLLKISFKILCGQKDFAKKLQEIMQKFLEQHKILKKS
jgi:hypothetical protein